MAALTWKEVTAPDMRGVNDSLRTAYNSANKAFENFNTLTKDAGTDAKRITDANTDEVIAQMQGQGNPETWANMPEQYATDQEIKDRYGNVDVKAIRNAPKTLLDNYQAHLQNIDDAKYKEDSTGETMRRFNELVAQGNVRGAARLIPQFRSAKAKQETQGTINAQNQTNANLTGSNINNATGSYGLTSQQYKDAVTVLDRTQLELDKDLSMLQNGVGLSDTEKDALKERIAKNQPLLEQLKTNVSNAQGKLNYAIGGNNTNSNTPIPTSGFGSVGGGSGTQGSNSINRTPFPNPTSNNTVQQDSNELSPDSASKEDLNKENNVDANNNNNINRAGNNEAEIPLMPDFTQQAESTTSNTKNAVQEVVDKENTLTKTYERNNVPEQVQTNFNSSLRTLGVSDKDAMEILKTPSSIKTKTTDKRKELEARGKEIDAKMETIYKKLDPKGNSYSIRHGSSNFGNDNFKAASYQLEKLAKTTSGNISDAQISESLKGVAAYNNGIPEREMKEYRDLVKQYQERDKYVQESEDYKNAVEQAQYEAENIQNFQEQTKVNKEVEKYVPNNIANGLALVEVDENGNYVPRKGLTPASADTAEHNAAYYNSLKKADGNLQSRLNDNNNQIDKLHDTRTAQAEEIYKSSAGYVLQGAQVANGVDPATRQQLVSAFAAKTGTGDKVTSDHIGGLIANVKAAARKNGVVFNDEQAARYALRYPDRDYKFFRANTPSMDAINTAMKKDSFKEKYAAENVAKTIAASGRMKTLIDQGQNLARVAKQQSSQNIMGLSIAYAKASKAGNKADMEKIKTLMAQASDYYKLYTGQDWSQQVRNIAKSMGQDV